MAIPSAEITDSRPDESRFTMRSAMCQLPLIATRPPRAYIGRCQISIAGKEGTHMISAKARLIRCDKALSSTTPLRDLKPQKDPAVCLNCQAVWHKGKWSLDPAARRALGRWGAPTTVLCSACRSVEEGNPNGILYLTGSFLAKNRNEILNLLRNTARTAAAKNPLERVIRMQAE